MFNVLKPYTVLTWLMVLVVLVVVSLLIQIILGDSKMPTRERIRLSLNTFGALCGQSKLNKGEVCNYLKQLCRLWIHALQ